MKDLIIVGAGGYGREALYVALAMNQQEPQWNILGFIDDNKDALRNVKCDYEIIGSISEWEPKDNQHFALGISNPSTKEKLVGILKEKGARFATLIHPNVEILPYSTLGEGCVVTGLSIGDNVTIGNFVHICGSMIGQDSVIGDFSTTTGFVNVACAYIGKRVFIGSHSVILNHLKVGDDAFVCAGSMVFSNVKSGRKVIGNPARKFEL